MKPARLVVVVLALCAACNAPATPNPPTAAPAPSTPSQAVRLLTHCGIRYADAFGRHWDADTVAPEPAALPGPGGQTHYDGYTAGTMTLIAADRARFVTDTASGPVQVDFHPATGPDEECA